jgi:transposase
MAGEYWLDDQQWAAIEPLLPKNQPGARRKDDRRVLSGIIHVLKVGCRWQDCPAAYGPATTIYNRFHRWARRGLWQPLLEALVRVDPDGPQIFDSKTAKAAGGKWGPKRRRSAAHRVAGERKSRLLSTVQARRLPLK